MSTLKLSYTGANKLVITTEHGNVMEIGSGTDVEIKINEGMVLKLREGKINEHDTPDFKRKHLKVVK